MIDGHAHACGSYFDIDTIKEYMKKQRIDKVILCGGEKGSKKNYYYPMFSNVFKGNKLGYIFNRIIGKVSKSHDLASFIDEQNDYVYNLSKKMPDQILNAYWINPCEENCIQKLQKFHENKKFALIKMHQCWTDFDIESENCRKIYEWAKNHRITIFIHLLSKEQARKFVEIANSYKDVIFIVAHMIGTECMQSKILYDNVYFDLSAPQLYSLKTLKLMLKNFGYEKLILGSDTPYGKNNINITLNRLKKCNLTKEQMNYITAGNITSILNLKVTD